MKNYRGNKMNKIMKISIVGILCIILSGCLEAGYENGEIKLISETDLGGQYKAKILYQEIYLDGTWYNHTQIKYEKDGSTYLGDFIPYYEDALNWILENTNENTTILSWWRYGHMIEGYSERNTIATSPSLSIQDTIELYTHIKEEKKQQFVEDSGGWTSDEKIEDISKILTTANISSDETREIIEKYNMNYILTQEYDSLNIAWIFFKASGKNLNDYIIQGTINPTDEGKKALIYQMWKDDPEIKGLKLVYEYHSENDFYDVRIYKIS
jgi:hypothetical protein